eukprot:13667979-Ditylum_brightwellii.AAC.1
MNQSYPLEDTEDSSQDTMELRTQSPALITPSPHPYLAFGVNPCTPSPNLAQSMQPSAHIDDFQISGHESFPLGLNLSQKTNSSSTSGRNVEDHRAPAIANRDDTSALKTFHLLIPSSAGIQSTEGLHAP